MVSTHCKLKKNYPRQGLLLMIAKWHIWKSRKRSLSRNITVFKDMIDMRYKFDKYYGTMIKILPLDFFERIT